MACQMLVAMLGTTISASASSRGMAKVMRARAIGGNPMPMAPLAMPATMKAPVTTSICRSVIRSARDAFRQSVERLPEPGAQRIGLHHDLMACLGNHEALAAL